MAKRQTRKSISVNAGLYPRAKDFAAAHKIPLAQLAEQAIEAVLDGRLVLESTPVAPRGLVLRVATHEPPPPKLDLRLKPSCANCAEPTVLDPADSRCATLEFGGGASVKPGLGEGSRWCSSKGVGK